MPNFIGIIVYSSRFNFSNYINLDGYGNLKITRNCNSLIELKSAILLNRDAIVVVDESSIISKENNTELEYLKDNKMKFVFCTQSLIEGLYANKYPRVDLLVFKNMDEDNRNFIWNLSDRIEKLYETDFLPNINETMSSKSNNDYLSNFNKNITNNKTNKVSTGSSEFEKIVAIGSSTGGTEVVLDILKDLPLDLNVPILVVQHMPENFTNLYAIRMNKTCEYKIKEAENGDVVKTGHVYIAPGGKQMTIIKKPTGEVYINIENGNKELANNPSVDILFNSVASAMGKNVIGVILTGMGKDGAKGLLNIKEMGGYTIGQDEKTSTIYGMPKVAFDIGAVISQLPYHSISQAIINKIKYSK